jgi:hypothetical protein
VKTAASEELSSLLITLMREVVYRDENEKGWQALMRHQVAVQDYVKVLGLELILDEAEGFAHLRQRPPADGAAELPRLVPRRQLGFPVSLILALLRGRMIELDATSGDTRLVVSRQDIMELVRLYTSDTSNEARVQERLETYIGQIVDLGFLRRLPGSADQFEVRRILKSFVDAEWLGKFARALEKERGAEELAE